MNYVTKFAKNGLRIWNNTGETSLAVIPIKDVFDKDIEGIEFFSSVSDVFDSFDKSNQSYDNKLFLNDMRYIMDCTIKSLELEDDSATFSTRTDSYFYIYRRIVEYLNYIHNWNEKERLRHELTEFKNVVYGELLYIFQKTIGVKPNVLLNDRNALQRINIYEHLLEIKTIQNIDELITFFVLYKLSLQSALRCDDHRDYSWPKILSNVQSIELPFDSVISIIVSYKEAFAPFSIDVTTVISFIDKTLCLTEQKSLPFSACISLLGDLNLDTKTFFKEYLPYLPHLIQNKKCRAHINDLFQHVSQWDEIFGNYLSSCASNMLPDSFWNFSINLIANLNFNNTTLRQVSSLLFQRTNSLSIENFIDMVNWTIDTQTTLNDEKFSNLKNILGTVFDDFVLDVFASDFGHYETKDEIWVNIYNTALKLSEIRNLQQPSIPIIINRLLFNFGNKGSVPEKILVCFRKIDIFYDTICKENDPKEIIKDEWLTEYTLSILSLCNSLSKSNYEDLRHAHRNHLWKSYFWSRIIHLSILKSVIKDPGDILLDITNWMKRVGHYIYEHDDVLTIVFVNIVFEIIIMKHIDIILSSPNIETIIDFILTAYYNESPLVNKKQVDEFIQKAQHWMKNIFLLRGKPVYTFLNLSSNTVK